MDRGLHFTAALFTSRLSSYRSFLCIMDFFVNGGRFSRIVALIETWFLQSFAALISLQLYSYVLTVQCIATFTGLRLTWHRGLQRIAASDETLSTKVVSSP